MQNTSQPRRRKRREELEKLQESRHDVCAKRKTLCEQPRATRKAVLGAEPPEEESEDPKAGEEKPKEKPEIKEQSEDYLTDEEWADVKARWAQEEVKWDAKEEIERRLFDEREHEWYASWVDFQALTTVIEGFSDDVFIQLHGLASDPTPPGDFCVCLYHHHPLDVETNKKCPDSLDFRKTTILIVYTHVWFLWKTIRPLSAQSRDRWLFVGYESLKDAGVRVVGGS